MRVCVRERERERDREREREKERVWDPLSSNGCSFVYIKSVMIIA